jgi:Mismatch repair ATPase (MutS family)
MMGLTYAQLSHIGFRFALDALEPCSAYGRTALRKLEPFSDVVLRTRELNNLEQACFLRREQGEAVARMEHLMMATKDIRSSLILCGEGKILSDIELFEVKSFLLQLEDMLPAFAALHGAVSFEGLAFQSATAALELLDPEGNRVASFYLSERYSSTLARIREEKRSVELALRRSADKEEQAPLVGWRQRIVAEEQAEEAVIRKDLSKQLQPYMAALLENCDTIARLDLLLQKAALTARFGGCKPCFGGACIELSGMRNPMLATALAAKGKAFTPVSITLQEGAAIITGANMGGKSVLLKTLALNVLLAHCGFFPFAEKAILPELDTIHLVSEDLESSDRGLSSFGGEIVRLGELTEALASEYALVLLDEFARGTNPAEGSSIAWALTNWLNEQRCFAVLTTHFEHVAEAAGAHWRVAGLMDVDWAALREEIAHQAAERSVSLIAHHMNYELLQVSAQEKIPQDAIEICRLLGFSPEIIEASQKKLLTIGKDAVK